MKPAELALTPNQDVIEALEGLLEDARAGKLTDYAIIGHVIPGTTISTFHAEHNTMALIGELRSLERDILDCCVDSRLHKAGEEY